MLRLVVQPLLRFKRAFMILPNRALMLARVVRCLVPLKKLIPVLIFLGMIVKNNFSTNVETKAISQAH